jgi:post-segregation antitoxin (ccd killing protein)
MSILQRVIKLEKMRPGNASLSVVMILDDETEEQATARWQAENPDATLAEHTIFISFV